jgi:hypothetical protein
MYENGWGVDQDSVLASGYYQNIKLSPGNLRLKKAIEPEWIKVQTEKKVLSRFNNHVEYADAESRLHPAGHSVPDPWGGLYESDNTRRSDCSPAPSPT